ncbi:MAG: metal-dependent hydrolase [Actinomycetia bacterium]|nr:metal-dependent hydrolase [Actinomycetes bacterium]
MADVSVTWLGHGSFRIDSPGGKRIYLDPWLEGNPTCPKSELEPERCDIVAVTHGHFDHVDAVAKIAERFEPPIVAIHELAQWLGNQGVPGGADNGMGMGGTQEIDGISFTLTRSVHSSSTPDGAYAGDAAGFVIGFENGTKLYASGDTDVFGDMELIRRLHAPETAILSIGDHYTMGPAGAEVALELLGVRKCIPAHWGTFPLLTGTSAALRELAPDVEVFELKPGQAVTV